MAGCIAPSDRSEYKGGGGGGCFESSFRSMLFCRFHYPPMCVFRELYFIICIVILFFRERDKYRVVGI